MAEEVASGHSCVQLSELPNTAPEEAGHPETHRTKATWTLPSPILKLLRRSMMKTFMIWKLGSFTELEESTTIARSACVDKSRELEWFIWFMWFVVHT